MVSFRKMSMAFAGCLIAGGIASAQVTPITCTVTATSPAIKLEGLTEQIGDVILTCSQPAGAAATAGHLLATIQIQSDGPQFTNTLADADARTLSGPTLKDGLDADLTDQDGNVVVGKLSADGKSVTFNLVELTTFEAAAAQADVYTISGLRINAQQSQGNLTSPKVKVTGISYNDPTKPLSISSDMVQVGTVQQAVVFAGKAAAANLDCTKYSPVLDDLAAAGAADDRKALAKVTFEANFPNSLAAAKLTARFTVPSGAKLYVATSNITSATNGAWEIAGAGHNYALITGKTTATFTEIKADDDGIYQAVWTVANMKTGTDTFVFPVFITIPQNFVSATALSAVGSIGPFSTVAVADEDAVVPRFVVPTASSDLISVGSCKTTLLFPYVTNVGNWDTGIAISNPTADMKNDEGKWASGAKDTAKTGQNGTCTLYFVGANAPEKAVKSSEIKAGETVAFVVSAGSEDYGIAGVPGFNGYLKVQCTFSEGRGFAFMSSSDLGGVGVGYVAEGGITLVP